MTRLQLAALKDGGELAYRVRGKGRPLLLCRPVGGSLESWGRFATVLARKLRVISFDARGTGGSSQAPVSLTTRAMARDAVELMDHLAIDRAHVFGLSLGGMVASWLAIDAGARVDRLVLASTMPRGLEVRVGALWRGAAITRDLARSPAEAEASIVTQVLSPEFRAAHPDQVESLQELARLRPASHRGLLTMLAAAARHDVRSRLGTITAPTLILLGTLDRLVSKRSQRELRERIPHARVETLDGAGHDLTAEAPEETAARVLAFLR